MNIGDYIESAIWITGDEPQELRVRYEKDVTEAIDYFCHEHKFIHSPITFIEKLPGADRVPPVPDHIQGSRVRLLVAESLIEAQLPDTPIGSFVANLDKKDLDRLRKITRRVYAKNYGRRLNDLECDEVIEETGPEAALDTLRRHIDGERIH
jgi:hypothetical protein